MDSYRMNNDSLPSNSRIAIVGSRRFPNRQIVADYVKSLPKNSTVISGGARGVDTWAEQAAQDLGLPILTFQADWKSLGKRAGPLRNAQIVSQADRVVAFWDMTSRGTLNTLVLAHEENLPIDIYGPQGQKVTIDQALQAAHDLGVVASIEKARKGP